LLYAPEFDRTEAKVERQTDRIQPELCRLIVTVDMDVRRLVRFVTEKIDTVWARAQYRWHGFSVAPNKG